MLRLDRVIKPWKESAALNAHINLYGFWNETAFLTKSGDVGMVLSISGVDYESLDRSEQEYAVKRLEAALKAFGPGFHVYQYLFKSNCPDIPFANYEDPVVEAAIDQRRKFFEAKREHLYQVEIFYCILLEGARSKTGVGTALARLFRDPIGAVDELKAQFTNDNMKTLLRTHIENDLRRLDQHVQAFARQLGDFMQIDVLNQQGQFTFLRRLLNYDDWRVTGSPQSSQFLDYQVVNSNIEAERNHLRVGDHIVRVLTMKEAITETRPLVLDALLKIPANFYVVTEWTPLPADKARKEVNKRRRHFNMSKTGFVSQMGNDATTTNPRDVLVDESKQADIENLGDCLRALGDGHALGDFSLTIVLHGRTQTELDHLVGEFTGVFTTADGDLFAETYNQLNAYFATVPGNYATNLRQLYLLNTNYADLSFLFTILPGEKTNAHLGTEYLAALETDNSTPYFLNLHNGEIAHTLILGMTGSGKTYLRHFELFAKNGDTPRAFAVLERVRGRTLAWALKDRKTLSATEADQTVALEGDVAGLQARLMRTNSAPEREQLLDNLVEYERRLGLAWTREDVANRPLPVRPAALANLENDLHPDEVLLEYVLDDPISFCISVTRRGAHIEALPIGRKEVETLAEQFIDEVRSKGAGTETSKRLFRVLLEPIPEAKAATRLIVAPDGALNLLPFEALRDNQGEYLLKSRVISYVPSGTILDVLRRARKNENAASPFLGVGDVAYENQGGAGRKIPAPDTVRGRVLRGMADLSGFQLRDLPQTRGEVEEIGKIVGPEAVVLLGKDATETAFKKEPLDQFRVLHLAVHGFADRQYPERSALVLGTDPKSGDDGLLQVREIIRLRLNAELTTLSACDTGVGKLQGQEGVSNLVEAFLVAGSKSVVASLWSADDTFASALMGRFYQRLGQGEDTSTALRDAKLDLLAKYGDQVSPFYWAAFVAVGETSAPIGIKQQ